MSTVCCPPAIAPQGPAWVRRLRQALDATRATLQARWRDWQARRRVEADLRVLRALDGATLRDLGLEHLVPPSVPTPPLRDRDHGHW